MTKKNSAMAVIFLDLDGTLIDPYPGISACFIHALEAMGLPTPARESLSWVVGPALIDSFRQAGVDDAERALTLYRERYAQNGLFEADV
ncbi:MAG TPA: HAD family hydrolase, partial [Aliiroseovarius sp.]|nr:HAD family hydrolase [Aliiroseovarius sp.]